MDGACGEYGKRREEKMPLVGKNQGMRQLGKPGHRLREKLNWVLKNWI